MAAPGQVPHPLESGRVEAVLWVAAGLLATYWTLWFAARSVVASDTRAAYVEFEQAFPAADAVLGLLCVAAAVTLHRRRPSALLWLLTGAGAGVYLAAMDVLYDVEHGIWGKGAGGLIELVINALTVGASLGLARWAWTRRAVLLGVRLEAS